MSNKDDSQDMGPVVKGQIVDIDTNLDESRMHFVHSIEAQFAQSREIRDQMKQAVALKVRAQHELLKRHISISLDVEQKRAFDSYLSRVSEIEIEFIRKLDRLDQQNDEYEKKTREEIYDFFDGVRGEVKKWENNPDRYQTEVQRLDEQEQKRLKSVKKRLENIEAKRENILDQTLKIFDTEYDMDTLKKKFNL
jgi:chromosome segregation ATPase